MTKDFNIFVNPSKFDILVIGGGHAGCEASLAAARLGCKTLLITGSIDRIAAMSCNPAIGGVGKGHLVKELDALGGEMGRIADATGIQYRTLNESRGPAVRATRCQSDMDEYSRAMKKVIMAQENLQVKQAEVIEVLLDENSEKQQVIGVKTKAGEVIYAPKVIITTGTFMGGKLHQGTDVKAGGRAGEAPAEGLSACLLSFGLEMGRLKTGTCPRIDMRTVDLSVLDEQKPVFPAPRFSWNAEAPPLKQVSCFITKTNARTHAVIQKAIDADRCPLFNGQLGGAGPRYCPSIEDKIERFPDKDSHLIFLEPHGLGTPEVYPNGLSTSLPVDVQLEFLRTMRGLENVEITRYGYAVEYDFVQPTELYASLESKKVAGLYCAGQINGTTGYEEAAMQGFIGGINAARAVAEKPAIIMKRHEAYAGVLVDDLISKGTKEPYRMFTSRAEHRLILREDNCHGRLLHIAKEIGITSDERNQSVAEFEATVAAELARIKVSKIEKTEKRDSILLAINSPIMKGRVPLEKLFRREEVTTEIFIALQDEELRELDIAELKLLKRVGIELKYEGYIERAKKEIEREVALDDQILPEDMFKKRISGMSMEVFEKLSTQKPQTLGQASRIQGITPAAIGLMAIEIRRKALERN